MEFKVEMWDPTSVTKPDSKQSDLKKVSATERYREMGITFSKFGMFPDCKWCQLRDLGKDSVERPDERHQLTCEARQLSKPPVDILNGIATPRRGQTKGETNLTSITIPVRTIRKAKVPVLDEHGKKIGEKEVFLTNYKFKTVMIWEHVWNGQEWVPWYVWNPNLKGKPREFVEPTEAEAKWLAGFIKKDKR